MSKVVISSRKEFDQHIGEEIGVSDYPKINQIKKELRKKETSEIQLLMVT